MVKKKLDCLGLVCFSLVIALSTSLPSFAQQAGSQVEAQENENLISEDTVSVVPALEIFSEIPDHPSDSPVSGYILKERFESLQHKIPLRYNEHSHRYVDFFVDKRTSFTRRMLETKDLYFPTFEKVLAKYNLPDEFKYLPLIESGLNPRIISRAGAGGLWQFMRATGRELGLQQNHIVDERFHPEKSTEAACRYIRQLYSIFGDWELVLAAYNCGPGNIRRAIRRTGKSDFWGIYPVLPKETRNYVPQFVAMLYVMNYADDHGLAPREPKLERAAQTIQVNGFLNLHTFTSLGGMTMDEIYELNPHLVGTHIQTSGENFQLKIPAEKAAMMADNLAVVLDSSSKVSAHMPREVIASRVVKGNYELVTTNVSHTVKSGQTLSAIARQYGVTVADLKKWNRMRDTHLKKGQRLVIHKTVRRPLKPEPTESRQPVVMADKGKTAAPDGQVSGSPSSAIASADTTDAAANEEAVALAEDAPVLEANNDGMMTEEMLLARQAVRLRNSERNVTNKAEPKAVADIPKSAAAKKTSAPIEHTIQKGENLILIAKKYGMEVDDLVSLNGLTSNRLVAGKKLKIAPGNTEEVAAVAKASPASTDAKRAERRREVYHVVQPGDTLWAISKRYGLSIDQIKKVNNIKGDALKKGMKILISG